MLCSPSRVPSYMAEATWRKGTSFCSHEDAVLSCVTMGLACPEGGTFSHLHKDAVGLGHTLFQLPG